MMLAEGKQDNKIGRIVAFVLAIAPILDPYMLFEIGSITIRLMDIPMLVVAGYIILKSQKVALPKKEIRILLTVFAGLTMLSFFAPNSGRSFVGAIKNLVVWGAYLFFVSNLWKSNKKEKFIKYATIFATVSVVLVILQFLFVTVGYGNFYDGRIPFLQLAKYDDWGGLIDVNTGAVRVHAFFQEPSYVGIYCLPVFAEALKREKFKLAGFLFVGLMLTSSLVAIIGGIMTVLFVAIIPNRREHFNIKFIGKIIGIAALLLIIIATAYQFNDSIQSVVDYSIARVNRIGYDLQGERMGSVKIRLLGYSGYFTDYPALLKIVGAGANQYPLLLSTYGVYSYSSTLVTTLLNYGIVGITAFLIFLFNLFKNCNNDKKVYALIFIIICFIDNFWFNWYFYYLLAWCYGQFKQTKNKTISA